MSLIEWMLVAAAAAGAVPHGAPETPCAAAQPAADLCACLRTHVESWGDGVTAACKTERRIAQDARIVVVTTTDRHAGTQYFIVHDRPEGASVLQQLEHHVPGGGGVYRDFSIGEARVQVLGPGRILRIVTSVTENEIPPAGPRRELSFTETVTLCALTTPTGGAPSCLAAMPLRERVVDPDTNGRQERLYRLELEKDGTGSHRLIGGATTPFELW